MPKLKPLLAAVLMITSGATTTAAEEPLAPILAIFAHPDDEVTVGPALARAAREGRSVRIVYATSGDRGPGYSGLEPGEALGTLREGEALCASAALGLQEPVFLRLGDAELSTRVTDPEGPAMRLLGQVGQLIAETRPGLVITWGPDGGYGHADHRMVSALATQAIAALPAGGRPQLFYPGIRSGTLPPVAEMQRWAVTDPALLDHNVAYSATDLSAAAAAVECHRSQFDEATRAGMVALFDQTIWQGAVHFREAL